MTEPAVPLLSTKTPTMNAPKERVAALRRVNSTMVQLAAFPANVCPGIVPTGFAAEMLVTARAWLVRQPNEEPAPMANAA
jgi:hypothetical protein